MIPVDWCFSDLQERGIASKSIYRVHRAAHSSQLFFYTVFERLSFAQIVHSFYAYPYLFLFFHWLQSLQIGKSSTRDRELPEPRPQVSVKPAIPSIICLTGHSDHWIQQILLVMRVLSLGLTTLSVVPTLVNGFDCVFYNNGPNNPGPNPGSCGRSSSSFDSDSAALSAYAICMVKLYSYSAFIQCATKGPEPKGPSGPHAPGDPGLYGPTGLVSAHKILTEALQSTFACKTCSLSKAIQQWPVSNTDNLADFLCSQFNSPFVDADNAQDGMCCLDQCLNAYKKAPEHSLRGYCFNNRNDLMNAKTISCKAADDSSDSGYNPDDDESTGSATTSSDDSAPTSDSFSVDETTTSAFSSSQAVPTTTSIPSDTSAPTTSIASASPTPQSQTGLGTSLKPGLTWFNCLKGLGLFLLSVMGVV